MVEPLLLLVPPVDAGGVPVPPLLVPLVDELPVLPGAVLPGAVPPGAVPPGVVLPGAVPLGVVSTGSGRVKDAGFSIMPSPSLGRGSCLAIASRIS